MKDYNEYNKLKESRSGFDIERSIANRTIEVLSDIQKYLDILEDSGILIDPSKMSEFLKDNKYIHKNADILTHDLIALIDFAGIDF